MIYKEKNKEMLEITNEERELLIECIQYRLETDKIVSANEALREDLEDLLLRVEESNEYL